MVFMIFEFEIWALMRSFLTLLYISCIGMLLPNELRVLQFSVLLIVFEIPVSTCFVRHGFKLSFLALLIALKLITSN